VLVTHTFTYVHQPKTGGTFVAAMLARIHEAHGGRVRTHWIDPAAPAPPPAVAPGELVNLMVAGRHQHGARRDIPAEYADRRILATVRHPCDRYVSQYEFAWWRTFPEMFGPLEDVRRRCPSYPDISFEEFVRLTNDVSVPYRSPAHPERTPGFHTQQFVEYFLADPGAAYPRLDDDAYAAAVPANELRDVHFIDQDRLNDELAGFLLTVGYTPEDADLVRHAERIWPPEGGRDPASAWEPYYSPELLAYVRSKEHRLFEWFPRWSDRISFVSAAR
jgi:hypothetical protein